MNVRRPAGALLAAGALALAACGSTADSPSTQTADAPVTTPTTASVVASPDTTTDDLATFVDDLERELDRIDADVTDAEALVDEPLP